MKPIEYTTDYGRHPFKDIPELHEAFKHLYEIDQELLTCKRVNRDARRATELLKLRDETIKEIRHEVYR